MAKTKMETVEKILNYEDVGEVFKTSDGELTEAELIARIRQGESFVVEVEGEKDEDGKQKVRALTVTTQGQLVYNDTQEPVRQTMPVENVELKEKDKEKKAEEIKK